MVPEYSKVSVFKISEQSAFRRVEKKAAAGIQAITVKILTKQESVSFSAKVIAISHEASAAHAAKAAVVKGVLKKEEPYERAKKRVRFAEGDS